MWVVFYGVLADGFVKQDIGYPSSEYGYEFGNGLS